MDDISNAEYTPENGRDAKLPAPRDHATTPSQRAQVALPSDAFRRLVIEIMLGQV